MWFWRLVWRRFVFFLECPLFFFNPARILVRIHLFITLIKKCICKITKKDSWLFHDSFQNAVHFNAEIFAELNIILVQINLLSIQYTTGYIMHTLSRGFWTTEELATSYVQICPQEKKRKEKKKKIVQNSIFFVLISFYLVTGANKTLYYYEILCINVGM